MCKSLAVRDTNKKKKRFKVSAANYAVFKLLMGYRREGFDVTEEFLKLGIPFLCRELSIRAVKRVGNRLSRAKVISLLEVKPTQIDF